MTKVLIVDDSATARLALRQALTYSPSIRVVGTALTGGEALRAVHELRPDIITMDVYLKGEMGLDVTAKIMVEAPTPILIVTGVNPTDPRLVFRALAAGALDVTGKPASATSATYEIERQNLIRLVEGLAQVNVARRGRRMAADSQQPASAPVVHPPSAARAAKSLVVIGASTGGPAVLQHILQQLPRPCATPVVIAQHITAGFAAGLAHWLQESTGHAVELITGAVTMRQGVVYVVGHGPHVHLVTPNVLAPVNRPPRRFYRPSIDELFESTASRRGADTAAVLLTGMGDDGAAGLTALRQAGAHTMVQSPESCVVSSMPQAAIDQGGACEVHAPEHLARRLREITVATLLNDSSRIHTGITKI